MALVAIFAASGVPYPLYERYRVDRGLTTGDLSWATVSYLLAVLAALLILGRVSDYVGRRPVTLAALVLAAGGTVLLLHVDSMMILVMGRTLQGLACGLGASATQAYILDTAPQRPSWVAAVTATTASQVGMVLGTLGGGLLAQLAPAPEQTPLLMAIGFMLIAMFLVLLAGPDPVDHRPGLLASLRPKISVPGPARPLMPAAGCVFVVTWALTGFYQSFAPTISAQYLGTESPLVAAIVISSLVAPQMLGAPISGRFSPRHAQIWGIIIFAIAVVGIVFGLSVGSVDVVIGSGIVAGLVQGAGYTGSVRGLLAGVCARDHAELMSAISLISYCGSAIPSLISGRVSEVIPLDRIAIGYAILSALGAAIVLVLRTQSSTK